MGWNSVTLTKGSPMFNGIQTGDYFYFMHSYYYAPSDPGVIATTTDYGDPFVSSVETANIFACQFHPEKSQALGLKLLRNFLDIAADR